MKQAQDIASNQGVQGLFTELLNRLKVASSSPSCCVDTNYKDIYYAIEEAQGMYHRGPVVLMHHPHHHIMVGMMATLGLIVNLGLVVAISMALGIIVNLGAVVGILMVLGIIGSGLIRVILIGHSFKLLHSHGHGKLRPVPFNHHEAREQVEE
ncbi:hypothetical protein Tco_1574359 [Tanacetum coccineum]